MIKPVIIQQIPRQLLLLADPDWQHVRSYLKTARAYGEVRNGQVVGCLILTLVRPGIFEIMNLAVAPAYQHQGIARQLLAKVIADSRADPTCQGLQLGTGNSSLRQLALYQRAGFELQDLWINYFVDNYPEPIYENGIQCKTMVRLYLETKR